MREDGTPVERTVGAAIRRPVKNGTFFEFSEGKYGIYACGMAFFLLKNARAAGSPPLRLCTLRPANPLPRGEGGCDSSRERNAGKQRGGVLVRWNVSLRSGEQVWTESIIHRFRPHSSSVSCADSFPPGEAIIPFVLRNYPRGKVFRLRRGMRILRLRLTARSG